MKISYFLPTSLWRLFLYLNQFFTILGFLFIYLSFDNVNNVFGGKQFENDCFFQKDFQILYHQKIFSLISDISDNFFTTFGLWLQERTMTRKRKKIINEIIESEKSYQHHLQLLITVTKF